MTFYDIVRHGLILAEQAEIDGMKAANEQCVRKSMPLAYNQMHFDLKADKIREITHKHDEQL